jgi:hypothetical protein
VDKIETEEQVAKLERAMLLLREVRDAVGLDAGPDINADLSTAVLAARDAVFLLRKRASGG